MSIAGPEKNSEFLAEFLDDYFAESEEHLAGARRGLLALEHFVHQSNIDRASLDDLFRSFHSLKGISGMVGVRAAERLAHQMESYLRALRDWQATLSPEGMDALIAGAGLLEKIISEHRAHAPITDPSQLMARLDAIISEARNNRPVDNSTTGSVSTEPDPLRTSLQALAIGDGKNVWRFDFVPKPELSARGINVNYIRAGLQQVGELMHAAPRVTPEGGIAFEFLVSTSEEITSFPDLFDDGVTYARQVLLPAGGAATVDVDVAAAPVEPMTASYQALSSRASNMVRVDLARLDELMRMVGDLVISRSRLDERVKHLEAALPAPEWRPLQETSLAMERQLRDLREGVMRVRMVPIGEIFERMQFVVRDLAREYEKQVKLELSGHQTEIDKFLVERLMDPILHLVRNAVSHGIEAPNERTALGKPREGTIALRASAAAETIVIEMEDDGRGVDAEQVIARACAMGIGIRGRGAGAGARGSGVGAESISGPREYEKLTEAKIEKAENIDSAELLELICAPGFSTRAEADRASGRGVGMNVVSNTIRGLGGTLELKTEAGKGTLFRIQLPLTLAIADALIVQAGHHRFAVPQASVREVIQIDASEIKILENNDVIVYRGAALPLLRLTRLFGLPEDQREYFHAFIVGSGLNTVGIAVDRILGQREIVVRVINDPLIQVAGVAGATELGDGRAVLILDAAALARPAEGRRIAAHNNGLPRPSNKSVESRTDA